MIISYSQWEKENDYFSQKLMDALLSGETSSPELSMLYATKGKARYSRSLQSKDLELLSVSYYERLSYKKVRHSGKYGSDGGVDVWLTRYDAEIEIVQCKQISSRATK